MNKFQNVLRELRKSRNLTQNDLAKQLQISRSTIGMYENGSREPDFETLELIADFFNIDTDYLLGRSDKTTFIPNAHDGAYHHFDNIFPIEMKKIPLLGEIACGEPILANEERESYVVSGTDIQADFCLKAKGDSMIGARIFDGDVVFIQKTDVVNNGDIAAVIIDDEVLLKRFYYFPDENLLTLISENPQYGPKNFTNEDLDHIHVLGKAIAFQSDIL